MKCLKVDEYIKQTSSVQETRLLFEELEKYVKSQPGLQGRTLCDRVIRACHHQLGVGSLDFDHITQLVKLVEISLHGYDIYAELVAHSSPFYMEKIIFHIVKKLSSLDVHTLCGHVAGLLYNRLSSARQAQEDYCVLVQSCFSVLWSGLSAAKNKKILNPRDKLCCQMQALSFLFLLDGETAGPSFSKVPIYAEYAFTEFESNCESLTKEDASFLLREINMLFNRCFTGDQACQVDVFKQRLETRFYALCEMVLLIVKMLCKADHHSLATTFLNAMESKVLDCVGSQCTPLVFGKWGVKIHSAMKAGKVSGLAFTGCARALRSLSADLGNRESHAFLEGCSLVVWAVESGHNKGLSGPVLLSLFSFLEEHQEWIMKMLNKTECSRLQQTLCLSIYQGFVFAYESMLASQLENSDTLDRVLLYCQSTAGLLMTELHKLSNENLFIKAVIAVSNLACGLYNRRHYDQAFTLVEILCKDLCKNCPVSLSVDRLSRPFMLAVQTSRRAGKLERALDWVILWLKALGDNITAHMSEPVSLWVKTKTDAAHDSDEDIRLRTLRDGFGTDVPEERIMLCLLAEELRVYKELARDTAQERYNTLCDLLDICHEESSHTHLRAVYLCEMAQVVCFQDFSEQTDCMAVDFIHEALRLLEEEPETPDNADRLKDDKAHALLWLYICSLEKNLQEAIESDRKRRELREQTQYVADPIGSNDFDYEDKQKTQDSTLVYEGLHFNLAAEKKLCQPLEKALDMWSALFKSQAHPSVRNAKQTCSSIAVAAALFRLMGKPLKALEAYQLGVGVSQELADAQSCASCLCQSVSILLDIGSPELALAQLEEAEKTLTSAATDEGPSALSVLVVLLKAQYFYLVGQIDCGLTYLREVLKAVNEQKHSKSWYLLRARTLQVCSAYLDLDTAQLPQAQRHSVAQHGIKTPDAALYESLKLLCSLLVTVAGKGLYGTNGSNSDVRFIYHGDNLVLKWQLLSELLNCSKKMVAMRSSCGAINDARLQCLEALKLAIKLQALSQCAELLVIKAELELMQGEREESRTDLNIVKNLLEHCTDISDQVQKADVKIKPRKGRPARRPPSPLPTVEDELKDILSTRWIAKEPVVKDPASSPPLKAPPRLWLSSLAHEFDCQCPCCSEPCLSRATARWAAAQADLVLQMDPTEISASSKLHWAALFQSKNITTRLRNKLAEIFPSCDPAKGICKPSLMQDVVGHVYLHMAQTGLETRLNKVCGIWKTLEAGLSFVDSVTCPVPGRVRAGLMATKAIASLVILAAKKGCSPEELYSNVWTWNAPEDDTDIKPEQKTAPLSSSLKKPKSSFKNPDMADQKKEARQVKAVKPKMEVKSSSIKEKSLVPKTPIIKKSKSSVRELGSFDFNTVVPTLACTPAQKVKCPAAVQKAPKTASKLQFHVYEELSPVQDKAQHVPAAPKRTKKSRFKVEFSDESDSEASTHGELRPKDVPKKQTATRKAASSAKMAPEPPAERMPLKRQAKGKKSTSVPCSSEDEDTLISQPVFTRKGRTRKNLSKVEKAVEEPDTMRTIKEEIDEVLDMSIEQLRTSDMEAEDNTASNIDFEVLRRDMCFHQDRDDLNELRRRGHPREGQQTHISQSDSRPDNLSLEEVQVLLRSAWLTLQHFPCPTIHPTLSALLALTLGQQDPVTTAMLHAQSLGVTSRHRTIRHLSSSLHKLKKASSELADKMDALSLNEPSRTASTASTEQRLSQMEDIFSFPTADPSAFPHNHCQEFIKQIQHLPEGVTVCLMSVLGIKPGEMGDSILLSRLEKDSAPVTLHISTSKQQHNISWLVQEMDNILVEQKVVSCVSEKAKWWEGRWALDSRVERLLKEMEGSLGCWKSLLLPISSEPELSTQAKQLCKALSTRGVTVSVEMLRAVLSASHVLSEEDLKAFSLGLYPQWDTECDHLLHTAMSQLSKRDEPRGHVVLILDKYLQKLPWESMPILKSCSMSRMPSLHSLLGLCLQKETDSQSILRHGVNSRKVFYVLDPDANLKNAQDRFKEWFCSKPDWQGVCGVAPDLGQLQEAVATKDLYIYVGHGAGARFLDSQSVLKQQMTAASLLFGCSSAALAVRGNQEGQGIVLNYLTAGCPFILGNLWDVTDRDIDRFTKALLESWFSAGSGAPLLQYIGSSRQATHLKYLIGAAPVVYGLPIHLQ
ncbi:separin isoform X2 [Melanotaenia boesemani]|uniref:separin isoform X2 n=1 Tax=Melanotaenia boesemani TaxID=1250792 RepID=UPI001C04FD3F|nr:separin isoform X2 [Melanotaenia boesemani]